MTTLFVSAPSVPDLDTEIIRRKRADSIFVRAANLTMSLSLDPLSTRLRDGDSFYASRTLRRLDREFPHLIAANRRRRRRHASTFGTFAEFKMPSTGDDHYPSSGESPLTSLSHTPNSAVIFPSLSPRTPPNAMRRPHSLKLTASASPTLEPFNPLHDDAAAAESSSTPSPETVLYRRLTLFGLEPPYANQDNKDYYDDQQRPTTPVPYGDDCSPPALLLGGKRLNPPSKSSKKKKRDA